MINHVDMAIIDTLRILQKKYGKKYCYPSQKTLLKLLQSYQYVKICRRTLNYHLLRLNQTGIIHRIRRHTKTSFGVLILKTTAYYILKKVSAFIKPVLLIAKHLKSLYAVQPFAHNDLKNNVNLVLNSV